MPSAVVLCFFPAFNPAASGGEIRLGKLYREVSKAMDVVLVTSTDFSARFEEIVHTPRFREFRVPKDELWRNAYATLEKSGLSGDLSGLAFALAVSHPNCALRVLARELASSATFVIHEFPFSEPIFSDGCPCTEIYSSHNFETSLLSSVVRGEGLDTAILKIMRLEGNLVARANRVFSTSSADEEKFALFYGAAANKLAVCPNGFDDGELKSVVAARGLRKSQGTRPKLLFTGSGHHPNVEAAKYLLDLAVELPECDILLAGGMCAALSAEAAPANVKLLGHFDEAKRHQLLQDADLFLNPVVLGSGTSLKALEALGAAVPMVSTPEGVRGLGLTSEEHALIVPRARFAHAVRSALRDPHRTRDLAASGHAYALAHFAWPNIAKHYVDKLNAPLPIDASVPPLLLALNDYSVMQPGSGGIARVRSVLAHLDCDVVLISFASIFEVEFIGPRFLHVTVPKSAAHRQFESTVNDGQPMSVNDVVASLFVAFNRVITDLTSAIARRAKAVIFEHPYMAPLLDAIARVSEDLPIIYSAHNVEATHKRAILQEHSIGHTLSEFIAELERRLVQACEFIVCCTDVDAKYFTAFGHDAIVVPNGCVLPEESTISKARNGSANDGFTRIGFLGSGHGPNVDAAEFIVNDIAPHFPLVQFEMIGGVCDALSTVVDNVALHGMVSEPDKSRIMARWDIALNPVESGGGSSLKLPDYFAHRIATLSTPAGARGFDVLEQEAGRVTTRPGFRWALADMLSDPDGIESERDNARRYAVDLLSWHAVTSGYRERLESIVSRASKSHRRQRLLVVTYRYTEPPLGGAEEYLIEVLKRLRPQFERIDLAAVDIGQLTNHHHFGCRFTTQTGGASVRIGELFDQAMYFQPDSLPEPEILKSARELERAWSSEELPLFESFANRLAGPGKLRVLGGFFWPENHNGVIRRWTSPEFSFLVPSLARTFQMVGYASIDKTIRVELKQVPAGGHVERPVVYVQTVAPYFTLNISLPMSSTNSPWILKFAVDEHHAPSDHRPFGVLLESASALIDREGILDQAVGGIHAIEISHADLSELHEDELRTTNFEEWIEALSQTARSRDRSTEDNFAAVRGPHSRGMQAWLEKQALEYDAVLVQGIPFDVIPRTVETIKRKPGGPRVVVLPHFHGDDRFYHWRRYYESFTKADATLLFSSIIAEKLGSLANGVVVPGGGVRSDEPADTTAEERFAEVYDSEEPFFLVLGRKTASKGYQRIIRAHQELRRSGVGVGLVLIGPDEDGYPVSGEGVRYLGRQPRNVIRGALSACLGLVTMSQSESFGIVLCEAWLFAKPVIANRACYSFRELVEDGETGVLVSTDSELVEAMLRLVQSDHERMYIGVKGFEKVMQYFTWETVADSCLSALNA